LITRDLLSLQLAE